MEKNGTVTGLRCRGGFELQELTWKNGKVKKAVIKSNLGGTLRIRTTEKLHFNDKELKSTKSKNDNPFFNIQQIKKPLIAANASINTNDQGDDTYLFDIKTEEGEIYTLEYK